METVFLAFKLTQTCYLNINIFSWKLLIWSQIGSSLTPHVIVPPSASPFDQIWRPGDKNLNFQTFQWIGENLEMLSKLLKNPTFPSLLWTGKNLEIYTAPDQHFKIKMMHLRMSWKNVCPNLSFTVENEMGNSHKRGWSHFKHNINDWDIPFPKFLRIYQWIGKNIFHYGENGMNPLRW